MATCSADRAIERWPGDHAGYDAIALKIAQLFQDSVPVRGHEHRAVFHEQKQMVLGKWLSSCRHGGR